jgi:hypothetical protein
VETQETLPHVGPGHYVVELRDVSRCALHRLHQDDH